MNVKPDNNTEPFRPSSIEVWIVRQPRLFKDNSNPALMPRKNSIVEVDPFVTFKIAFDDRIFPFSSRRGGLTSRRKRCTGAGDGVDGGGG